MHSSTEYRSWSILIRWFITVNRYFSEAAGLTYKQTTVLQIFHAAVKEGVFITGGIVLNEYLI